MKTKLVDVLYRLKAMVGPIIRPDKNQVRKIGHVNANQTSLRYNISQIIGYPVSIQVDRFGDLGQRVRFSLGKF